jgi:hypothetical protein
MPGASGCHRAGERIQERASYAAAAVVLVRTKPRKPKQAVIVPARTESNHLPAGTRHEDRHQVLTGRAEELL